jgi:hypothetical protein
MHTYVAPTLMGGFGNRLFALYAALHYAKQTDRQLVLIQDLIDKSYHESDEEVLHYLEKLFFQFTYYKEKDYNSWKVVEELPNNEFSYIEPPKYNGHSVIFKGYFQHPNYLPNNPYKPIPYQQTYKHTYFLHIRLGDYKKFDQFQIPIIPYYNLAIRLIKNRDSRAKFLVFSNENDEAERFIKKNIIIPFEYSFSSAKSSYDTLYEMSCCVGAICANSSLSWLGAYYQKPPRKNIFMPSPWIKTKLDAEIYPDWVRVISNSETTSILK